jgi:hypothetical protein
LTEIHLHGGRLGLGLRLTPTRPLPVFHKALHNLQSLEILPQSTNLTVLVRGRTLSTVALRTTKWLCRLLFQIAFDLHDRALLDLVVACFQEIEQSPHRTECLGLQFGVELVSFDTTALEPVAKLESAAGSLAVFLGRGAVAADTWAHLG